MCFMFEITVTVSVTWLYLRQQMQNQHTVKCGKYNLGISPWGRSYNIIIFWWYWIVRGVWVLSMTLAYLLTSLQVSMGGLFVLLHTYWHLHVRLPVRKSMRYCAVVSASFLTKSFDMRLTQWAPYSTPAALLSRYGRPINVLFQWLLALCSVKEDFIQTKQRDLLWLNPVYIYAVSFKYSHNKYGTSEQRQ